jgi:diguanylate cyclase (GGDEF)-like protein
MERATDTRHAPPPIHYRLYAAFWLAVGAVLLVASVPALGRTDRTTYLVFALLAVAGNTVAIRFPPGVVVSMQAPFTFAAVWVLGWQAAPLVNFLSSAILPPLHRISPWRAVVFAGNASLAMSAAGYVFWRVAGGPLRPDATLGEALLLLACGSLFSLINTVSVSVGRYLETGDRAHVALRRLAPLVGFTLLAYTPVSYLLALAYQISPPVFLLTVAVWLLVGITLQGYRASRELHEQLEQATREMERLSTTDPLTELLNRRVFLDLVGRELARHRRYGDPVSLVMLDLRGFKRVNDTLGHQAGDAVLQWVAHVLRRRIRRTDTAFRLGGDEFAVLCPATGLSGALALAESLCRALRTGDGLRGADVTAGVASCPEHGSTLEELVRAADRALYRAREEGVLVRAAE